jgi:hypothetical protein
MDESREPTKRELRQQKREIKRAGNQRVRRRFKQALRDNPEEAADCQPDLGRCRSAPLNGMDHDATRRRPGDPAGRH